MTSLNKTKKKKKVILCLFKLKALTQSSPYTTYTIYVFLDNRFILYLLYFFSITGSLEIVAMVIVNVKIDCDTVAITL